MTVLEELRQAAEWFEQSPPPDPATMPRRPVNRILRDAIAEIENLQQQIPAPAPE